MKWRKFNGEPIKLPIYQAVENAIKRETDVGSQLLMWTLSVLPHLVAL